MIENIDSPNAIRAHQTALLSILKEFDRVCRLLNIPYVLFAGTLLGAVRHEGFIPWDDDLDILMFREDYELFLREAEGILDTKTFFLQKEFSAHWPMFFSKLRLNNTACLEQYHPKDPQTHQGIYMDIFPCDNAVETNFGRKLQFLASKVVIAKSLSRRGYDTDSLQKKMFIGICKMLPMRPFLKLTKRGKKDSETVHSFFAGASGYSKNVFPRSFFAESVYVPFEDGMYPISKKYDELLQIIYGDYMTLPSPEQRVIKRHAILVDTEISYEKYRHYRDGMKFKDYTRSIR